VNFLTWIKNRFTASADISTLSEPSNWLTEALCGVKSASGRSVSTETALRASGVLACIRVLSEDLSTLPLRLYVRTKIGSQYAVSHPLFPLLYSAPNDEMTSVELREHMVIDMLTTGGFYNLLDYNGNGDITAITPMAASCVAARRLPNGRLVFDYNDPNPLGTAMTLPPDRVWRGNMLSQYGIVGRSLVLLAREAIGLALAAEEQGARFFSNGAQITGFLQAPPGVDLTTEQRKDIADQWKSAYGGSGNAFKTALLQNGLTYQKLALTPEESQYIETRKYQLEDIARIFRVPGVLLGVDNGKSSTYASASEFFGSYVKHTLLPWVTRIEQTISRDLLVPSERSKYFAKHNMAALLRADTLQRYQAYQLGINSGWMCRADAREQEEMNWVPGLDKFTVPLNTGIVQPDGSVKPATPPPAPAPQSVPDKIVKAAADRVARKEAKSKKFDAEFVVEVMQISPEQAKEYCDGRTNGTITDENAAQTLVQLATEVQ
jgi:HK97 family phage portal protein